MSLEEENYVLMARYISRQGSLLGWFDAAEDTRLSLHPMEGAAATVAVQHGNGEYTFEPSHVHPSLAAAIERLNVRVAFTMSSEITGATMEKITPSQTYLNIPHAGVRIPIVQSLDDIYAELADNVQCTACFVRKENFVLVWADAVGAILHNGTAIEGQLLGMLWGSDIPTDPMLQGPPMSSGRASWSRHQSYQSSINLAPPTPGALDEKNEIYMKAMALEEGPGEDDDVEEIAGDVPQRPVTYMNAMKVGLAMILVVLTNAVAVSNLLNEYAWDGAYLRFLFVLVLPATSLFSLFIMVVIINCVFQLFLPLGPALYNTKYHSAIKPKPSRHRDYDLPHVTIQMPVYKEGLKGVIVPTIMSLIVAIQNYEERGGTASIFVNDDGMQAIEPDLADARKQYYAENNIGYCARLPNMKAPKSSGWFGKAGAVDLSKLSPSQRLSNEVGFVRKGKFKKASNMNYCLDFSNRVEDEVARLTKEWCAMRGISSEELTTADDDELYDQALGHMLAADGGKTWAAGNIRIGEIILIVDCDTRVPVDCLLYGALEMHESPEVAIIQHGSGVMQVVENTFENGITYFTNVVYTSIKYGVGAGDVAPFVGHNAFLRWKAVQSISFVDHSDGKTKFWSDSHVSEDFDISLRLQVSGNVVRLATYHDGGFKEGVSFTLYDELARWEKYAYGCNELVFHPVYKWIYKGPITGMFIRFLFSSMPVTSKTIIVGYIFTYYAIGAGLWLALANYIILGLFPDNVDHFYLPSWNVFITCVLFFNGVGPLAFAMLRHRLKERQFLPAVLEAAKWFPFFAVFFSGLSLHCSRALLCHMFSINIEWTSTAKELGPTGFYIGLDKMIKSFRFIWIIVLVIAGGMIYLGLFAPWGYSVTSPIIIAPLAIQVIAHFILPIALGLV